MTRRFSKPRLLPDQLDPLPAQKLQNLKATAWFEKGIRIRKRRGGCTFDETHRDDPVLVVQERIRSRLLNKHFNCSLVVSFAREAR